MQQDLRLSIDIDMQHGHSAGKCRKDIKHGNTTWTCRRYKLHRHAAWRSDMYEAWTCNFQMHFWHAARIYSKEYQHGHAGWA
jgi:hypothetical protein